MGYTLDAEIFPSDLTEGGFPCHEDILALGEKIFPCDPVDGEIPYLG